MTDTIFYNGRERKVLARMGEFVIYEADMGVPCVTTLNKIYEQDNTAWIVTKIADALDKKTFWSDQLNYWEKQLHEREKLNDKP